MDEEELSYSIQDLQRKFQDWFGDSVSTDVPFQVEGDHEIGRVEKLPKLSDLLSYGFAGAVVLGAFVGFIILMMNFGDLRSHSIDWTAQIVVLSLAIAFGFLGGMFVGIGSLFKVQGRKFSEKEY
jgi:hypothetical protein